MSRFCFCNCPAGFSAEPERHAPDCPGRSGAGKARTPVPVTVPALTVNAAEELDAVLHWRSKHTQAIRERDALQLSLTTADEKNDTLSVAYLRAGEREHKLRLRAHRLEGLLSQWANLLGVSAPGLRDETLAVLKPTQSGTAEHICPGCGTKGWTACCTQCVPY